MMLTTGEIISRIETEGYCLQLGGLKPPPLEFVRLSHH